MGAGDVRPPGHWSRGGRARAQSCRACRCCWRRETAAQVRRRRRRRVPQPGTGRFVLSASIPLSSTTLLRDVKASWALCAAILKIVSEVLPAL
jgi:hypothetical protein